MQPTERLQPVAQPEPSQGGHLALVIGMGALCASLIAAALLRPALLRGAFAFPTVHEGSLVTATLSVTLLVSSAMTIWVLLIHLAPRVARAPVATSVPAVALFSSGAIVAMPLRPPMAIPPLGFVVLWIPLLVVGGALGQQRGLAAKGSSLVLCLLPLLITVAAQVLPAGSLEAAYATRDVEALRFLFVVGVTCITTSLLALTLKDVTYDGVRAWAEDLADKTRAARQQERASMAMLVDVRDSVSLERAALAREQKELDALIERAEQAMDERVAERRALMNRGILGRLVLGLTLLVAAALGAHYLGARSQAQSQDVRLAEMEEARAAALSDQRRALVQAHAAQLAELRDRRADAEAGRLAAEAALQAVRDELSVLAAAREAATDEPPAATPADPPRTAAKRPRRAAAHAIAKKGKSPAAAKAGRRMANGATAAGLPVGVDDDPIGGL